MAQHDYVIDNSTGANVRADINNVLQAIATNNSGSSAPSATFASQFFADTSAGIMKLRNTSDNGYVNLFTLAGGIDVDAASNFNGDVTFTGASANIVFNKSNNAFEFADNAKATFGAGGDLEITHGGSNSVIAETGTGNLELQTNSSILLQKGNSEFIAKFISDGAVELYHDNSKKIQTTSDGVQWFGKLKVADGSSSSNLLTFGDNADLQIFHDGTNSNIKNQTGHLNILSSQAQILNPAANEAMAKFIENGAVELYHDNSKRFETTSSGGEFSGTDLVLDTGTGSSSEFIIKKKGSYAETCGIGLAQGSTTFGNNSINFRSMDSNGNMISDISIGTGISTRQRLNFADSSRILMGNGADFQLLHNGSNSFIVNSTGFLDIQADALRILTSGSETQAKFTANGAVELYHDNNKKFETTSTGITISNMNTDGVIVQSGANNLITPIVIDDAINNNFLTDCLQFKKGGGSNVVGSIQCNRVSTAYNTTSDYRLKENAVAISDGITRLKTLKPYRFNFKGQTDIVDGFFAHEVTAVPEAITGTKDQVATENIVGKDLKKNDPIYQQIDQSKLVPLLVAAVQELIGKVEALEAA